MIKKLTFLILVISCFWSCSNENKTSENETKTINDGMLNQYQPEDYVKLTHPEWSKNAAIYQLNTRQFSEEGTFKAAQAQLPRLKDLGIDIIWLMPIHAIGEKNRKGTLGSPIL